MLVIDSLHYAPGIEREIPKRTSSDVVKKAKDFVTFLIFRTDIDP